MTDSSGTAAKIVVVDDDEDTVATLAELLRLGGYRVETATDGESALGLVRTFEPHCVLLDVHMPGMDGSSLARRLRADFPEGLVLIALTGHGPGHPGVSETFRLVDHHFRKPVDFDLLAKVLPPVRL